MRCDGLSSSTFQWRRHACERTHAQCAGQHARALPHGRPTCGTAHACSPARASNMRDSTRVLSRTCASTFWLRSVHVLISTCRSSGTFYIGQFGAILGCFPRAKTHASFVIRPFDVQAHPLCCSLTTGYTSCVAMCLDSSASGRLSVCGRGRSCVSFILVRRHHSCLGAFLGLRGSSPFFLDAGSSYG